MSRVPSRLWPRGRGTIAGSRPIRARASAPMGEDARALIGLDPAIVPRPRGQSLLGTLDIAIGMHFYPGMIERRMVGHEIKHESQAAGGEPGAERGQRRLPTQRLIDLVSADGE